MNTLPKDLASVIEKCEILTSPELDKLVFN